MLGDNNLTQKEYQDSYIVKLTRIEDAFNEYRDNASLDALYALKDDSEYSDILQKWLDIANMPNYEQALLQLRNRTVPLSRLSPYSDIMLHCQREWRRELDLIHIVYIYSGSFSCEMSGRELTLETDCCYMFNTHVRKTVQPLSDDSLILNCLISQKYLEDILLKQFDRNMLFADFLTHSFYTDSYTTPMLEFDTSDNDEVRRNFTMAIIEHVERGAFYYEMVNSHIYLLITHLLRLYTANRDNQHYIGLGNNKLSDILIFIDTNCAHTSLSEVAANFHFHPNYLSKIIKTHTNLTFTDILQDTRLKKAAALLRSTEQPITDISNQVGYSNVSHFYNIFKGKYNCTPAEYRVLGDARRENSPKKQRP